MLKKPLEVHLHTNNTCNLFCRHCYNRSGGSVAQQLPPVEKILLAIRYLSGLYDAEFHLEGGETFLRRDLLAELDSLPDDILKKITITTNGTMQVKEQTALHMLRRIGALRVSVEGHMDSQQEMIRGIPLQEVLMNADFYQKMGVPVWLRITLNRMNMTGFVSETLENLVDKGFPNIQVYEFQDVGRGKENRNKYRIEGTLHGFFQELGKHGKWQDAQVRVMLPKSRGNELEAESEYLESRGLRVQHFEDEEGISIHSDGAVYLCPWDNDESHILFNFYQKNEKEVFQILNGRKLLHQCGHCSAYKIIC